MKNLLLWLLLAFIWGNSFAAIKIALETITPMSLVAVAYGDCCGDIGVSA